MNHADFAALARNAMPCTAAHITFGGRCLNCGWDPNRGTPPHPSRVIPTGREFVTGVRPAHCPPHDWPPIPPFKTEVECRRCGPKAILRRLV